MTPQRAMALRSGATRGPWSSIRVGKDGDGSPRSAEVQICAGDEPNAPAVFLIQGDGSDEWRANVLLAATAPELIDAYLEEHAARVAADRPRTFVLVYVDFDSEKRRVGVRAFSAEHAIARWKLWEMRGESNGVLLDIEPYDPERDDHVVEIR